MGYDNFSLYVTPIQDYNFFHYQVQTALIRYRITGHPQVIRKSGPKSQVSDSTDM